MAKVAEIPNPLVVIKGMLVLGAMYFVTVVLPQIAIYLLPSVLLIGLLYFEIRAFSTRGDPSLIKDEIAALSEAEEELKSVGLRLAEIDDEGSHLKRNVDGSFHRGSKLGQALNDELDDLSPRFQVLNDTAVEFRNTPLSRFNQRARAVNFRFAFRISTITYIIILFLAFSGRDPGAKTLLGLPAFIVTSAAFLVGFLIRFTWSSFRTQSTKNTVQEFANVEYDADFFGFEDEGDEEQEDDGIEFDEDGDQPDDSTLVQPWYETLEVSSDASVDQINAAWRSKMRKNHPDRVAELDHEFQELAEERTKRLNSARDEGLRRQKAV